MKYWIRGKVVRLIDHYYIIVVVSIAIINPAEEENVGRRYLGKSFRKRIFRKFLFLFRSQSSSSSDDHKKRLEAVRF